MTREEALKAADEGARVRHWLTGAQYRLEPSKHVPGTVVLRLTKAAVGVQSPGFLTRDASDMEHYHRLQETNL
jgi:hypothetical protein